MVVAKDHKKYDYFGGSYARLTDRMYPSGELSKGSLTSVTCSLNYYVQTTLLDGIKEWEDTAGMVIQEMLVLPQAKFQLAQKDLLATIDGTIQAESISLRVYVKWRESQNEVGDTEVSKLANNFEKL